MRAVALAVGLGALWGVGCAETTTSKPKVVEEARVVVCAPGSYSAGNECLPVKRDCPPGTQLTDGSCVAPAVASDEPPPDEPPKGVAASEPDVDELLDPRPARKSERARQLLITEVQGLETLFRSMDKAAPDRPLLLWRLADAYVELGAVAERDMRKLSGDAAEKMSKVTKASRQATLKYYSQLESEYPKYCRGRPPKESCMDEVVYFVGVEHLRAGELDKARKAFFKLVQAHPRSTFVPHAYFQFGEMFRAEAVSDPSKWTIAEQSYEQAAKSTSSPVAPWALLRHAEAKEKQGDAAGSGQILSKLHKLYPNSRAAQIAAPPSR